MDAPNVIVLAGPNGAGKSTISNSLIRVQFGCAHFVNADTIARGLSAFNVEAMALKARRIMLQHLHDLAAMFFNHAKLDESRLIAEGCDTIEQVHEPVLWQQILAGVGK